MRMIPLILQARWLSIQNSSSIVLGKHMCHRFSTGNCQKNQKLSIHDITVVYMRKDSKTAGSGRKVKY
ncbi:hypothetical protein Plhal304r1_c010g0037981 [Plasmopara halstedii]